MEMNNKLSEGLISIANALTRLAYDYEIEVVEVNNKLALLEETSMRNKNLLTTLAHTILDELEN